MSALPSRSRARGFTLLELLVASTITFLAVGMATMGFITQNQSLQAMDMTRVANESSRDAMLQLETSLRRAGWGVDPRHAIDMVYKCTAAGCRDRTGAPDELVFVARNPMYRWLDKDTGTCTTVGGCFEGNAWKIDNVNITSAPKTVSITLLTGQAIEKGRVVLATCAGGQSPVMLTLDARATPTGSSVPLVPVTSDTAPYNVPSQLQACHDDPGAGLFLVDRFRYFIATQGTTEPRPWLMLDTGLNINGADEIIPIAKNVEDLQVAYVLQPYAGQTPPDTGTPNGDWIIGNDRSSTAAEELSLTAAAPDYKTATNSPSRYTKHPANVRGVRVSLTLRSVRTDARMGKSWAGESVPGTENRADSLSGGAVRRYISRTQITLRNMDSKSPFTF